MKRISIHAVMLSAMLSVGALGSLAGQTTRTRAPANASAKCNDGTYSTAKNERGACSRHGGIAQWLGGAEANQQAAPRGATARCTDGTYSKSSGKGVCSRHGGVSDWLSTPPSNQQADTPEAAPTSDSRSNPAEDQPAGATARCTDGSYTTAASHSGACSRHGGVAEWLPADSTTVSQDIAPAGATARCKDGSYSRSAHRSGTCSYHGGVSEWIRRPPAN